MKDFQTILAEKREYYGHTEAAIEFAAEEFARQAERNQYEHDKAQVERPLNPLVFFGAPITMQQIEEMNVSMRKHSHKFLFFIYRRTDFNIQVFYHENIKEADITEIVKAITEAK